MHGPRPAPPPHFPGLRADDLNRLAAALSALAGPTPVPLTAWRDEVMARYAARHRNTRNKMRQALREALALAPPRATTADLTPALVDRFAARPGRASTTNGLLASLRCAVGLAADRGHVAPGLVGVCAWRVPDRDPPRRRHHGRADVAKVLAHLEARAADWEGRRLHALACTFAYCGLRTAEALRLRPGDVDPARGFLFVRPHGRPLKTPGSEAPVPVPDALAGVLARWLPCCGPDWVFPGVRRRGPWTGGSAGRRAVDALRAAGEAAGVPGLTPRSLRHSLATHLAGWWGLGRPQVRLVLRHTTDFTQGFYVHPDLENLRESVRGFDFSAPAPPGRRAA